MLILIIVKLKISFLAIVAASSVTIAGAQVTTIPADARSAITAVNWQESQVELPEELSDEELDAVTGGNPLITIAIRAGYGQV